MFIEIHHYPQGYYNKKETSFVNTDYIVAIHTIDLSIHTVSGCYTKVDSQDIKKLIHIVTNTEENEND